MINTTLCYIECSGKYLMLYRNKKKNDLNEGKWIGIGGKFEAGETSDAAMLREVREETGVELSAYHFHGIIHFRSDKEDEEMYLYSAVLNEFQDILNCDEGELSWIDKDKIMGLSLWEGDRRFLDKLLKGEDKIEMLLRYEGDSLVECIDMSGYQEEAREKWGKTESYKEFENRSQDNFAIGEGLMQIFKDIGPLKKLPPDSHEAKDAVLKIQKYITDNFYTCSDDIFKDLGIMYMEDERFRKNIDSAGGEGTARFISKVIELL